MESLREAIANNRKFELPDLPLFYGLIAEMDKAVPDTILLPRKWGKIRRAARLEFVS